MAEEMKVSISSDDGIKKQWARGLLYRNDGRKKTLVPKNLAMIGFGAFGVIAAGLLVQGTPEPRKAAQKATSNIPAPSAMQTDNRIETIPPLGASGVVPGYKPQTQGPGKTRKVRFTGPQLVRRPGAGKIPPGSFVKAKLLSGASNGPVRAEVTEALSVNGETLIEEGTTLLGSGQSGEDRLNIRFAQMVSKDGAFQGIDAQACDGSDKIAGLKGTKVGSQAIKLATGIGLNFAGGMSTALQDTQGEGGAVITRPTLRDAMLNGAATAALDQSREMMSDVRNKPAPIEVPAGTEIYILMQGNGQ